jgi:hypothetical protein
MATLEISDLFFPAVGFWNVDQPVGPGVRNKMQDVKVVQVLLRIAYFHPQLVPNGIRDLMPLKTDGICGSSTQKCIRAFQQDPSTDFTGHLVPDGRVDRSPGDLAVTPIHRKTFTIVALSLTARRRHGFMYSEFINKGPDHMAALMLNPAFL